MKKGKRILVTIIAFGIAVAAIFAGVKYFGEMNTTPPGGNPSDGSGTYPPPAKALSDVKNISYDENRLYFVWDDVQNADGYVALINGMEYEVDASECYYVPTEETTVVKVKAVDSTGEYSSSAWSSAYTYTLDINNDDDGQVSYLDVNSMVQSRVTDATLKNVVSIETSGPEAYIRAIFEANEKNYLFELILTYSEEIESLDYIVKNINDAIVRKTSVSISEYDCARLLVMSDSYTGNLQDYKNNGYTIELVYGATNADGDFINHPGINIYATYRLSKGTDVKYVSSYIEATVIYPSTDEATNYTSVVTPSNRELYEHNFQILEGDFATFAEQMYNAKNASN
jgi:hypothetical protein